MLLHGGGFGCVYGVAEIQAETLATPYGLC
jgi:hypothetical protein